MEDLNKTYPEYQINYRCDGRIEVITPAHSVGHTIYAPPEYKKRNPKHWADHGCDGTCNTPRFNEFTKKFLKQHFGNNTRKKKK